MLGGGGGVRAARADCIPPSSDVIPVASRRWRSGAPGTVDGREIASFGRAVRTRRYDDIIDTQGLVRSALIARLARGRRHGYDATAFASERRRGSTTFSIASRATSMPSRAIAC